MQHKIGAYIRVSTEEQANIIEGSTESQQHRVKSYLDLKNHQEKNWGKIIEIYIDDGFSAKDTKRPAYQRMMRDMRAGKINLILVTDLSRLSRNIADFCKLQEELSIYKAKFLSIKEQFDSSTPAGEMMLYNMINLAQFERKQTSERVSMNFHSRAMRGLLNGNPAILGYDRDETNSGKYVVNEQEAILVRKVFDLYLEHGTLNATASYLNGSYIKPKKTSKRFDRHVHEGTWTYDALHNLLTNKSYIGIREVNKCNKNKDQSHLKPWQKFQEVKASWPGIVPEKIFFTVNESLSEAWKKDRIRRATQETRIYLLSGIIRCKECGQALIGQTSHGKYRPHRYYGHKTIPGKVSDCKFKRFRADEVEEAILNHLQEAVFHEGHFSKVEENLKHHLVAEKKDGKVKKDLLHKEMARLEKEIEAVFKLQLKFDDDSSGSILIQEKLNKLADEKKRIIQQSEEVMATQQKDQTAHEARMEIEDNIHAFKRGWKKATPTLKRRLLRRLFQAVSVTRNGIEAFYVITNFNKSKEALDTSKVSSKSSKSLGVFGTNSTLDFNVQSASSLVFGARSRNRTTDTRIFSPLLYRLS